jgi:hypothetical protein
VEELGFDKGCATCWVAKTIIIIIFIIIIIIIIITILPAMLAPGRSGQLYEGQVPSSLPSAQVGQV